MSKTATSAFDVISEIFTIDKEDTLSINDQILLINSLQYNENSDRAFSTDCTIAMQVMEGEGSVSINGVWYKVNAPSFLVFMPGFQVKLSFGSSPKLRASIMADSFMQEFFQMSLQLDEIRSSLLLNPVLRMGERHITDMDLYVRSMISLATNPSNAESIICARYLTMAFFYGSLIGACRAQNPSDSAKVARLASEFKKLLQDNYVKEHKTGFYANSLGISEKHLYMAVKNTTGQTPSYWIDFYLMSEAKNLLATSTKSIQEVSDSLNFASQSHFSKFFRRLTGQTPISYRNGNK